MIPQILLYLFGRSSFKKKKEKPAKQLHVRARGKSSVRYPDASPKKNKKSTFTLGGKRLSIGPLSYL
jgi:hypothetical protein